jgi:hypothetical protein
VHCSSLQSTAPPNWPTCAVSDAPPCTGPSNATWPPSEHDHLAVPQTTPLRDGHRQAPNSNPAAPYDVRLAAPSDSGGEARVCGVELGILRASVGRDGRPSGAGLGPSASPFDGGAKRSRAQRACRGRNTSHHHRTVPVPAFLVELVARRCRGKGRETLVLEAPTGGYVRQPNGTRGWFEAAWRTAGVPRVTPHDLRHTAASFAVRARANAKAVQRMLGHASAATTLGGLG